MLQTMLELLLCFAPLLSDKILCCKSNLCFQSLDSLKRHLTRQARLIPEHANAGASSKESSKNKRRVVRQQRSRILPFPEEAENAKGPTRLLLRHPWHYPRTWKSLGPHYCTWRRKERLGRQLHHLPLHGRREQFRPSTLRTTGA